MDGDPPPRDQMMVYFVGHLFRGPNQGLSEADGDRVQREHLAHMRRQQEAGHYVLTGPFADDLDPRGLIVMRAESLEAAQALAAADPAVREGLLRVVRAARVGRADLLPDVHAGVQQIEPPRDGTGFMGS